MPRTVCLDYFSLSRIVDLGFLAICCGAQGEVVMFSENKFARLVSRFYCRCYFAIAVNVTIVFIVTGLVFGSTRAGLLGVLVFVLYSALSFVFIFLGFSRLPSPPFYHLPDTCYPIIVSEWSNRLAQNGYDAGPIVYYLDVSGVNIPKELIAAVFLPSVLMKKSTLLVSESFIVGASADTIVAFVEHEIGHLRSGTHKMNELAKALSAPLTMAQWWILRFRDFAERHNAMCVATKLYGLELCIYPATSHAFEHIFELIADALAAKSMGSKREYVDAIEWVVKEGSNDSPVYEHDEHVLTHPSFRSRKESLDFLFS